MKKILVLLLAAVMMLAVAVPVAALDSPQKPGVEYKLDIVIVTENGTAMKTANEDGTITLTATPDEGRSFVKWYISGSYAITAGALTETTVTIKPASDLVAYVYFDGDVIDGVTDPLNPGDESPITGNNVAVIALIALVSFAGAAYAVKRSGANA